MVGRQAKSSGELAVSEFKHAGGRGLTGILKLNQSAARKGFHKVFGGNYNQLQRRNKK